MRTNFLRKMRGQVLLTQKSAGLDGGKVRFPKRIQHGGRVLATINGKSRSHYGLATKSEAQ
jgi:hypothetical protein